MLVAGGTGSIGAAVATLAAREGWRVVVQGRTASADGIATDLREPGAAAMLVAEAGRQHGRIDAVVDCASMGPAARIAGPFGQTEPDAFAAFAELSLAYVQRLAHAALPWLGERGGTFVAVASDAGRFAAPNQALIGASRAGTIAFVRNLAVEVARNGVRVHCISPSFVAETRSYARASPERAARAAAKAGLGLPTPGDIAPAVLFLCGDGARRITGQVISINGGLNA